MIYSWIQLRTYISVVSIESYTNILSEFLCMQATNLDIKSNNCSIFSILPHRLRLVIFFFCTYVYKGSNLLCLKHRCFSWEIQRNLFYVYMRLNFRQSAWNFFSLFWTHKPCPIPIFFDCLWPSPLNLLYLQRLHYLVISKHIFHIYIVCLSLNLSFFELLLLNIRKTNSWTNETPRFFLLTAATIHTYWWRLPLI